MSMIHFQPDPRLYGMRVVKYIRCSHDDQVLSGDTLDAQDSILDEFIRANRMVLVDTFIDEATTARKSFMRRKEFVRLLDGVRSRGFEMILFTKLDRWFRNIADYYKIQEILEANDVQWKAVTESYDTSTTNGRLHVNIRLSVAQDECDRDSDRIKDVFSYKLKNKTYVSGSLPRGLKLDAEKHIVIDPEWTCFALDMFDHLEATCSKRATQLYLQEKYGIRVCYDTIARYLTNPLFKGQYRDDPDFCEPTISPERWERIQKLAYRNVRIRHTRRSYIFAGLLVCSSCRHMMAGTSTYRKMADGSEKAYIKYRCNYRAQSKLCDRSSSYSETDVEEYVLRHIRPALSSYIASFEVSAASSGVKKDPAAEIAKIERKMRKLYDLFMDDLIDKESYRKEYDKFQKQLEEAHKCPVVPLRNLDHMKKLLADDWEAIYQSFDEQEKNAFWKSFIEKIVVFEDGEMEIYFL